MGVAIAVVFAAAGVFACGTLVVMLWAYWPQIGTALRREPQPRAHNSSRDRWRRVWAEADAAPPVRELRRTSLVPPLRFAAKRQGRG